MGRKNYLVVVLFFFVPGIVFARNIFSLSKAATAISSVDSLPSVTRFDSTANDHKLIVGDINITGNKKTRHYIIERELPFKKGDTLSLQDLTQKFVTGRQQLINTQLFHEVAVYIKQFRGYVTDIQIDVKERWYIIPLPYVKPVDRNFSAWADKGYNLNRLNYGLKFYYDNFTGRNDKLKLMFITGYTHQYSISYDQPYADNSLKHGFGASASYSAVKELNVSTINNKQFFLNVDSVDNSNKYINQLFNFTLSYYYRPAIYTRHIFRLGYTVNKVDNSVLVDNPKYFTNGSTSISYPEFSYTWRYQNIDYMPYPRIGKAAEINFVKRGFTPEMNLWQVAAKYTQAWPLGWKLFYVGQVNGTVKLPFDQPYYNQRLIGYGDFSFRGLEKYVVDGVAGVAAFNTIKREIINTSFRNFVPLSTTRIPLQVFVKAFTDVGYSYTKPPVNNSLQNSFLYTYGVGVDVVTYYDLVFRFECSFNQLGEHGLFFHLRNDF
jgi:outer membrane protein assembly factor BamA